MTGIHPFGDLFAIPSRNGVSVPKGDRSRGTQMINMGELFRFDRIGDSDMARVPLSEHDLEKSLVQPGDLLFARRSLQLSGAGRCSIVEPASEARTFESSLIRVRLDLERASPDFYFYFFKSRVGRELMETIVEQAVVAGIRASDLKLLNVPVPLISEQRGVAATLGALDDKIESNRRAQKAASELIDALAQNMLMVHPTRTLRLAELVEFNGITKRPDNPADEVGYVDIASVSPGRVDSVIRTTWEHAPSRARRGVSDGDVIYSTVRPGRRSFSVILDPDKQTVVSTGFAVMSPEPSLGTSLLTTVAGSPEFALYLESVAHGSAYPAVSVEAMGNYVLEVPADPEVIQDFEVATMPLRRRSHQMDAEIRTLEVLRDTLLPELLSGRIRVPEAREAVA